MHPRRSCRTTVQFGSSVSRSTTPILSPGDLADLVGSRASEAGARSRLTARWAAQARVVVQRRRQQADDLGRGHQELGLGLPVVLGRVRPVEPPGLRAFEVFDRQTQRPEISVEQAFGVQCGAGQTGAAGVGVGQCPDRSRRPRSARSLSPAAMAMRTSAGP